MSLAGSIWNETFLSSLSQHVLHVRQKLTLNNNLVVFVLVVFVFVGVLVLVDEAGLALLWHV